MKPEAKKTPSQPHYPSRRDFIQRLGMVAVGVGLAGLAMPPAAAGELRGRIAAPVKEPDKKAPFCAKTCSKEIEKLVVLLGSPDFRKRKLATEKLIAIGKGAGKDKNVADQMCDLVVDRMEKLKKAKDPEIVGRAKAIIDALKPKPVVSPPREHHVIIGKMKG